MTTLQMLWLPILLSAVLVFIVSSVIHMGPFWHRSDYPKLPMEEQLRTAVRPLDLPPGDYMVPRPSGGAEMRYRVFVAAGFRVFGSGTGFAASWSAGGGILAPRLNPRWRLLSSRSGWTSTR